jgi:hypothetical protein
MKKWKIIGRHKWVSGATITESTTDDGLRRYTATIRGWNNWKIAEEYTAGKDMAERTTRIITRVKEIRDRIDAGDQSIFMEQVLARPLCAQHEQKRG